MQVGRLVEFGRILSKVSVRVRKLFGLPCIILRHMPDWRQNYLLRRATFSRNKFTQAAVSFPSANICLTNMDSSDAGDDIIVGLVFC